MCNLCEIKILLGRAKIKDRNRADCSIMIAIGQKGIAADRRGTNLLEDLSCSLRSLSFWFLMLS